MTDTVNKSNELKGKVETYIDKDGNLVVWRPQPSLDWNRLMDLPEEEALAELFAVQTANGYDWLMPVDFGGFIYSPILGWQVTRDANGKYISAEHIYRFCGFRLVDRLRTLPTGRGIIFYKVK